MFNQILTLDDYLANRYEQGITACVTPDFSALTFCIPLTTVEKIVQTDFATIQNLAKTNQVLDHLKQPWSAYFQPGQDNHAWGFTTYLDPIYNVITHQQVTSFTAPVKSYVFHGNVDMMQPATRPSDYLLDECMTTDDWHLERAYQIADRFIGYDLLSKHQFHRQQTQMAQQIVCDDNEIMDAYADIFETKEHFDYTPDVLNGRLMRLTNNFFAHYVSELCDLNGQPISLFQRKATQTGNDIFIRQGAELTEPKQDYAQITGTREIMEFINLRQVLCYYHDPKAILTREQMDVLKPDLEQTYQRPRVKWRGPLERSENFFLQP